jgi:hypothetical protein
MKHVRSAAAVIGLFFSLCAFADQDQHENAVRSPTLREQTRALQMEQLTAQRERARMDIARNDRAHAQPAADESRRGGKMTAEDRRALRRQIDEAGHDIYTPSR